METLYYWKFLDKKQRSDYVDIFLLALVIGIFIWGAITKQYGLSLITLFVSGVFHYIETNSDEEINVFLMQTGLKIGNKFYEYGKIKNFSYNYKGGTPVGLILDFNLIGIKNVNLKINEEVYLNIKDILPNYIKELDNK